MADTAQEELVDKAAEPITPTEPVVVVEGEESVTDTPVAPVVEESVVDPNADINARFAKLEGELAQSKQEADNLKYQQQLATQKPVEQEPGLPTPPDPYSENFAAESATYTKAMIKLGVQEATKGLQDQLKGVELLQGDQVLKESIRETKESFSDFDFTKEQKELAPYMQNGYSMLHAKKVLAFDNMAEELKQLKSGKVERDNLVSTSTNVSTKSQETPTNEIKIKLTSEQEQRAVKIGKTKQEFAEMVHRSQQRGEI